MVANENQYRVTQERARQFARLVSRMESGAAQRIPGESPAISQVKLDAAKSVLRDLRQELEDWEAIRPKPPADRPPTSSPVSLLMPKPASAPANCRRRQCATPQ